jgi:hypothetical protein
VQRERRRNKEPCVIKKFRNQIEKGSLSHTTFLPSISNDFLDEIADDMVELSNNIYALLLTEEVLKRTYVRSTKSRSRAVVIVGLV